MSYSGTITTGTLKANEVLIAEDQPLEFSGSAQSATSVAYVSAVANTRLQQNLAVQQGVIRESNVFIKEGDTVSYYLGSGGTGTQQTYIQPNYGLVFTSYPIDADHKDQSSLGQSADTAINTTALTGSTWQFRFVATETGRLVVQRRASSGVNWTNVAWFC